MTRPVLFCVCPECGTPFELKGQRLKDWKKRQRNREVVVDPFCSYVCSSSSNAKRANSARRLRLQKEREEKNSETI
jgi:hypothetical protein